MSWKETSAMDEKNRMIGEYLQGENSITDLSRRYGVSRPTVYKWIVRYECEGPDGLQERSRARHHQAHAVSSTTEQRIIDYRQFHPDVGPKKIRVKLKELYPRTRRLPAVSTIGEILKRPNLVVACPRWKNHSQPSDSPLASSQESNDIWSADFKGWFCTGDQTICYPLTVSDHFTRFFLCCQGLVKTDGEWVQAFLEQIFRQYGLPRIMRTDNGPPFASTGLGGLTRLSIGWIKLGIRPERIQPGKPQQNGRHERLHRTLKRATLSPPAKTLRAQQKRFDRFLEEYNWERPHEALGQIPPGDVYEPSLRPYSGRPGVLEYPEGTLVRQVKANGEFSWCGRHWYLGQAFGGERVSLKELDGAYWQIGLGEYILGKLDMDREAIIEEPDYAAKVEPKK